MTSVCVRHLDSKYGFAISRRDAPEVCSEFPALSKLRAQGMPGARCARVSDVQSLAGDPNHFFP
jgi:hypothetical protein